VILSTTTLYLDGCVIGESALTRALGVLRAHVGLRGAGEGRSPVTLCGTPAEFAAFLDAVRRAVDATVERGDVLVDLDADPRAV
jgi:hypothetical protein